MCAMLHLFPEAATNALLATDEKSIDDLSDREIAYFYCEGYRYAPSSASLNAIQTLSFLVLCVLGDVYRVQGQLKEAEQIFQSIVRACSTYPLPHHNLHQGMHMQHVYTFARSSNALHYLPTYFYSVRLLGIALLQGRKVF